MTKYSEEFKLMVVQEYLSGSIELLKRKKGITTYNIIK